MSDCLFCRIVSGELPATVVQEREHTLAFRDIDPKAPTHVLVVPRRHLADVTELAEDHDLLAALVTDAVAVARAEGVGDSGWRLVFNTGRDAGQTVFHVHAHVLGGQQMGFG